MSNNTIAILSPIWIGIAFNFVMIAFNMIGMTAGLQGRFIDWYLGYGGFLIMGGVWSVLIAWAIWNGFH